MNIEALPANPSRREALRTALSVGAVDVAIPGALTLAASEPSSVVLKSPAPASDEQSSETAYVLYF